MKWQTKNYFALSVILIFVAFGFVFLKMNEIAKTERAQIQLDVIEVQQNIAVHVADDYEEGLSLVDKLLIDEDYYTQKITFELLDDLVFELSQEEALIKIGSFMANNNGALNIYNISNNALVKTMGEENFYVSQPSLGKDSEKLSAGSYKVIENPFKTSTVDHTSSKLYYYYMKSQPWMLISNRNYDDQTELTLVAQKLENENMNQVHSHMNYEIMIVNSSKVITNAYSKELIGTKITNLTAYDLMNKGLEIPNVFTFDVDLKTGIKKQWIGTLAETKKGSLLIATEKSAVDRDQNRLSYILFALMIVNACLAISVVFLIYRNYLYFLENKQMEGESNE